jgi:hypothetical protein
LSEHPLITIEREEVTQIFCQVIL